MSKILFNEFEEVPSKQWKQKIQADLKGTDYNETLVWNTNENINVKPFYHADEFNEIPKIYNTKASQWNICQSIFVANTSKSNLKAIDALNRGAESINFILPTDDILIDDLLKGIDLSSTPIHFYLKFINLKFIKQITKISSKSAINIQTDIIGNLCKTGNWFTNLKEDHKYFESIVKETKTFSVDTTLYQNAGATIVQQLAYALAHANEYLNHLEENKEYTVTFNVSVGTNYFFEIAKLRALRILWKSIASEYSININCKIFVTPTKRNKTIYDYNTNMLRTTTECMSAILGGANSISNLAYDAIYHKDNEFGDRISRNQLLILKHESYFDKVNNPADGAYYIECLTEHLANNALDIFKTIETNGGFLKQLKEGTIQRKIKESARREQEQFNAKEIILLGTNKYPNPNDKMKNDLELYPFIKTKARKTLIEPIIEKRLSEKIEQERLKTETY